MEDDLEQRLARRRWQPVEIERGDRRLQLHPVHGKLGAGCTRWKRRRREMGGPRHRPHG